MAKVKTHVEESDVLIIGGGMAGTGATFEARHWGRDLKIVCVEKANIDRSGAVAQGLYAINCYMGMQWDENQPEDHVRYARNDLMGMVREDLGYDMARHVDSTVHMFDEWGLPMMKNEKTGKANFGDYKSITMDLIAQTIWAGMHGVCALHITMENDDWVEWSGLLERVHLMQEVMMRGLIRE